jgi:hypothetical protein
MSAIQFQFLGEIVGSAATVSVDYPLIVLTMYEPTGEAPLLPRPEDTVTIDLEEGTISTEKRTVKMVTDRTKARRVRLAPRDNGRYK